MEKILILHGPNLNLLGSREPEIYGDFSLNELNQKLIQKADTLGFTLTIKQSNHEGLLIDWLHDAISWASAIVFNPGGYTHTSIAIRDAIASIPVPVIEVHLSNIHAREEFRHKSLTGAASIGVISGFGAASYLLALDAINSYLSAIK